MNSSGADSGEQIGEQIGQGHSYTQNNQLLTVVFGFPLAAPNAQTKAVKDMHLTAFFIVESTSSVAAASNGRH